MGKQPLTATALEERLRELIREGNGAAKDLRQTIDGAKREMVDFSVEQIDPAIRAVIDERVQLGLRAVNRNLDHLMKEAVNRVIKEFEVLAASLIGMELRTLLLTVLKNEGGAADMLEIQLGAEVVDYLKDALRRGKTMAADAETATMQIEWGRE